jgi:hypothetical protein
LLNTGISHTPTWACMAPTMVATAPLATILYCLGVVRHRHVPIP